MKSTEGVTAVRSGIRSPENHGAARYATATTVEKNPEHNRSRGSVSSRKMSRSSEEGDLSGPERHNLVLLFNVWNNTLLEAREGRTIYRDDRKPRQLGFFPAKRYELRRGSTAAVSPVSGGCRQLTVSSNHLLWKPNRMPADWKSIATLSFLNPVAPPSGTLNTEPGSYVYHARPRSLLGSGALRL